MMAARAITTIDGCIGLRSRSIVVMALAAIMRGGGVLIMLTNATPTVFPSSSLQKNETHQQV